MLLRYNGSLARLSLIPSNYRYRNVQEDASAKLKEIVADIDLNEDIIYDEDDYNLYGMDEIH